MSKNNFLSRMDEMKRKSYMDGFTAGKEIQRMAMCIALNETYGFAGERLEKLVPALDEIWSEMKTVEPELFTAHIIARAKQIKGVTVGGKYERTDKSVQ